MSGRQRNTDARWVSGKDFSVLAEVRYIIRRAQKHECRVVALGPLVFFSTEGGDAWVLDPKDELSLQLARDGAPLPVNVKETDERFQIEWTGTYRIDGDVMTFAGPAGQVRSIVGYPTAEIVRLTRAV